MTFEEKTLDETIEMFKNNAEYERIHGNLQGCLGFSQLVGWLVDYKRLLEQTRWIPVSEKLPKDDNCYLVTSTGTNNDIVDIAYYTESLWHKASCIKAWMPLPEPYREDGEQE